MNLGHLFVIETRGNDMETVKASIQKRIWNYPLVVEMPFGLVVSSIDGAAITIKEGDKIPSFSVIRHTTDEEENAIIKRIEPPPFPQLV